MPKRASAGFLVGGVVGLAALVACSSFSATGESAPESAADAGVDAGAASSSGGGGEGGPASKRDAAPPVTPIPAGNVGAWAFDTDDACAAWSSHHAQFTWVAEGHDAPGACRLCNVPDDPGPASAEVQLPSITGAETFSIVGYVKLADASSPPAQLGIYPRKSNGDSIDGIAGSTSVTPTATWTKSNVKMSSVDLDSGAAAVFAQLALLGSGCIEFDDVTITATPQ